MSHTLILKDREDLSITGVTDVDCFDEGSIVAYTDYGEITITGSELHISSLNLDTGQLSVQGTVASLSYLDQTPKSKGFLSKVFR